MTTTAESKPKNLLVGTWTIVSGKADPHGANRDLFGPHPSGQLIFTENLRFMMTINDPRTPRFASEDPSQHSDAENRAALAGAIAAYGTYTVDSDGQFASERVIGSTNPNWNGLERTTAVLRMTLAGETMTEHLQDPGGPQIEIVWRRT